MRQYEQGERFIRAVEAIGGPRAAGPGVGRARDAPHHGRDPPARDLGGADRTGSASPPADGRRPRAPRRAWATPSSSLLSGRCTFPPPGTAARLCGVGRRRLAGAAGPGRARRDATSPPSTSTTACGPDRPPRPRWWPAAARPVRGRVPGRDGRRWPPAPTSRPGPAPPVGPSCPTGPPPATPWTTRPRPSCQPAAGGGARRAGRRCGRARATPCSGSAAPRPGLCARARARPGGRPVQRRPPLRPQPGPPRAAPPVLGDRRARRGAGARPPGRRCWPTRPTCSTSWRPAIDPTDADALAARPGPLARRAARRWLRRDGPHPPDLAAVERVLAVARGEARATDVAPGVRVRRSRRVGCRSDAGRPETRPVVSAPDDREVASPWRTGRQRMTGAGPLARRPRPGRGRRGRGRPATSGWPSSATSSPPTTTDRPPLLVGVLKGAFVFMSDLARAIQLPVEVDVMAVASYGSATTTSGVVRIVKDLDSDLTDRHVLVVEDIVDSGLTLSYLRRSLLARQPASLEVCALLVKEGRQPRQARPALRRVPHPARFRGGLRARRGRALPQLCPTSGSTRAPSRSTDDRRRRGRR